ncbi:ABC transporter substrate-binding protein [Terrarubrum flagellatum]|uniref:ABC transporter substrate-binding protein n=1 Tax=Terrirubrum flagellatum TaxID=2895980 RepID=UPI0031454BC3
MTSLLRSLLFLCLSCLLAAQASAAELERESAILTALVKIGKLPPLEERVPKKPRVIDLPAMGRTPGKYGGTMRMLMGDQRDIRMMTIYGYARLVVFDDKGELKPDILESFDVRDGRIFTLKIRPGHKWSDGHPFTAEDFRYFWEDVANNTRLNPAGPPLSMMAAEKPPKFEIIDELTVRYIWDAPNPAFLPSLAGAQSTDIAMPAHYLKQFHEKYADPKQLAALVKAARFKDWGALHERKSRHYRPENPDLPVLDPWRNTTAPPAELYVFERNPYYHRVDNEGRQLPYVDRVTLSMGSTSLVPAKVGAGESDLQARYIRFDNYTFLKESQKREGYTVRLWTRGEGAWVALLPNLNTRDPVWRDLLRDARFRRALSVGINRRDINQAIFYGLGQPSANTVIPGSPFYKPELQNAWAQCDPVLANKLLDEIGLTKRDSEGYRLLPDGRRAELTIDASGEFTEETDVLELISYQWAKIGIRMFARSSQRDVFRRRALAGQTVMSIWVGMDNGTPGPDNEPNDLAPSHYQQYQWPLWGQYVQTAGQQGEKPETKEVLELVDLLGRWRSSATVEERADIWRKMLDIQADQAFTIGIVNRTSQPVVVSGRLRNVPDKAIYSFEPGAFFGSQLPETFWFDDVRSN